MTDEDWDKARHAHLDDLRLTRREMFSALFAAFATFALLREAEAARPQRRMPSRDWIDQQSELSLAFKRGEISPKKWMEEVKRLASEVDIPELMATVNISRITEHDLPVTNDPRKRDVRFIDVNGEPRRLGYVAALFSFNPTNVITPHAHEHMASAHMVVEGQFRVRNYDRVRDEQDAIVIRPTRDFIASVGSLSAMTSAQDNIHWFVPHGGPAKTFDVVVSGLDVGKPDYAIQAIDPYGGELLADGTIRAPIMTFENASKKYTAKV